MGYSFRIVLNFLLCTERLFHVPKINLYWMTCNRLISELMNLIVSKLIGFIGFLSVILSLVDIISIVLLHNEI